MLPDNRGRGTQLVAVVVVVAVGKQSQTGATSQSLLWNFYRCDTAPASKKCSLIFGLFQYQSDSEGKSVRLFYIPVVKTKPGNNQ